MRIEVIEKFRDIHTHVIHNPGEVMEVPGDRGANIIAKGVGREIVDPAPVVKEKKGKEAEPVAKDSPKTQVKGESASDNIKEGVAKRKGKAVSK